MKLTEKTRVVLLLPTTTLTRVKVVRQDKLYLAFLAISCAGFSSLAARELVTLGSRDRRTATTAVKEAGLDELLRSQLI